MQSTTAKSFQGLDSYTAEGIAGKKNPASRRDFMKAISTQTAKISGRKNPTRYAAYVNRNIAYSKGKNGFCNASNRRLADELGISVREFQRYSNIATKNNHILVEKEKYEARRYMTPQGFFYGEHYQLINWLGTDSPTLNQERQKALEMVPPNIFDQYLSETIDAKTFLGYITHNYQGLLNRYEFLAENPECHGCLFSQESCENPECHGCYYKQFLDFPVDNLEGPKSCLSRREDLSVATEYPECHPNIKSKHKNKLSCVDFNFFGGGEGMSSPLMNHPDLKIFGSDLAAAVRAAEKATLSYDEISKLIDNMAKWANKKGRRINVGLWTSFCVRKARQKAGEWELMQQEQASKQDEYKNGRTRKSTILHKFGYCAEQANRITASYNFNAYGNNLVVSRYIKMGGDFENPDMSLFKSACEQISERGDIVISEAKKVRQPIPAAPEARPEVDNDEYFRDMAKKFPEKAHIFTQLMKGESIDDLNGGKNVQHSHQNT